MSSSDSLKIDQPWRRLLIPEVNGVHRSYFSSHAFWMKDEKTVIIKRKKNINKITKKQTYSILLGGVKC